MILAPLRRSRALLACGFTIALLPACASSLPKPPGGPVPADAMFEVPYPPPAARVESIPDPKVAGQVWLDGQWEWSAKDWKWRDGAWTTPPPNAYFTPWTTRRRADGQLLFAAAAWRDRSGRALNVDGDANLCSDLDATPRAPPGLGAPR